MRLPQRAFPLLSNQRCPKQPTFRPNCSKSCHRRKLKSRKYNENIRKNRRHCRRPDLPKPENQIKISPLVKHCPSAIRLRFHEPHRHKDTDQIGRMTIFPPCTSASGKRVIRPVNTPLRTMRLHSSNIAILSAACSSDSTRSRTTNVQACHGRALKMDRPSATLHSVNWW